VRLALIPPFQHVALALKTDYQLLLPQCLSNTAYVNAYREARADGSFMILDNGAAEGLTYDSATLHTLAEAAMVNEIVVHDTLADAAGTWSKVLAWAPTRSNKFNYMAVVQGTAWDEIQWILQRYNAATWIETLGIPRHMIETLGTKRARLEIVEFIQLHYPKRFKIHLLGTNPTYMREIWDFRNDYNARGVRGVDTSAPFNYAQAQKSLRSGEVVNRPEDYFNRTDFDPDFLLLNLRIMQRWSIDSGRAETPTEE
jgi:hypothetical protein